MAVLLLPPAALPAEAQDPVATRRAAVEASLLPQVISPGESGYDIRERMAEHRVPGLSVAVINDGRVEWAAGYGVTRLGTADSVRESTMFQGASVSKSLTAVAVLRSHGTRPD